MEAVLDAARVKGWRTGENPARWKGHLAGELPQPRKVKRVRHRPALAWQEMGAFMAALTERDGIAAQALRFVILTAARTGEVRGMRWREVDLDAKVWVGARRSNEGGPLHRVPLSSAALAVLNEVRPLMRRPDDLVFPERARQRKPLSDMALSEVVRRMNEGGEDGAPPRWRDAEGRAVVPHGFRSTFPRLGRGDTPRGPGGRGGGAGAHDQGQGRGGVRAVRSAGEAAPADGRVGGAVRTPTGGSGGADWARHAAAKIGERTTIMTLMYAMG